MVITEAIASPQELSDLYKCYGSFEEFGELALPGRPSTSEKERYLRNLQLAREGKLEELSMVDSAAYTRCFKTYSALAMESRIKANDCTGFDVVCKRPWSLKEYSRRITLPVNREVDPSIIWIYGQSATGKTYIANHQKYDNGDIIPVFDIPESKDFAEYRGEIILVVNEFQGCFTPTQLIKWTEETRVNAKYLPAFQLPKNKILIITSNGSPDEIYKNYSVENPLHFEAFKSRCLIIKLTEPNPQVRKVPIFVEVDNPEPNMKPLEDITNDPFKYLKTLPKQLSTRRK